MAETAWMMLELVGLLVVPPMGYLLWIRMSERHNREPIPALLGSFGYGATAGVAMAILLNQLVQVGLDGAGVQAGFNSMLVASVVMAPLIEEAAKGFGLSISRIHLVEMEDAIIHGACIGLGFAATENAIYAGQAILSGGLMLSIETTALRSVSSMVLHAVSAAFLGFGYTQVRIGGASRWLLLPYFALAAGLHASYNFLVQLPEPYIWPGFAGAITLTLAVALVLRARVHEYDRAPAPIAARPQAVTRPVAATVPPAWRATTGPTAVAAPTFRPTAPRKATPIPRGPRPAPVHRPAVKAAPRTPKVRAQG